jgi:hypothetical protein
MLTLTKTAALTSILVAFAASNLKATTYTFSPTPADLNDLDHHLAYTWRLSNLPVLPAGTVITGATLTFSHIANWNSTANMLYVHLLDTAKYAGVASFTDGTGAPVSAIHDNFANPYLTGSYNSNPDLTHYNPLVAAGTGNTFLFSRSFTTTPINYTFTFTATELAILQGYIQNGQNIAFGFDPDCHYFNDGITFTFITQAVPESGSSVLLLTLSVGLLLYTKRRLNNAYP